MKSLILTVSVVTLLGSNPWGARTDSAPRHPVTIQAPDGKALYTDVCKKCHGVLGTPPQTMKKKYPKIASFDAEFLAKISEDSIVTVLTKGKGEDMDSVKDKMSAAEIRAVAKYVRELAARPKGGGDD
jgi:mono/diheme cytochrome c family protein